MHGETLKFIKELSFIFFV